MLTDIELYKEYGGKPVLVTGGAGFIGSHLVEALVTAGARVRVMDDLSTGNKANLVRVLNEVEFIVADIRDAESCFRAAKGIEIVFHEAALVSVPASILEPTKAYRINIEGTSNVFEAARANGTRRVVYASSSAVYGDSVSLPLVESQNGRLMSPYAVSKRSNELLAEFAYSVHGTTSVGLRYFNVYGARQNPDSPYAAVIPIFMAAIRAGGAPRIFGDGSQTRDFVNVQDVARANLLAGIARQVETAVVNVGSGIGTSIGSLAEQLCVLLASAVRPQYAAARQGDITGSIADVDRADKVLGFRATVELSKGLAAMAAM